MAKDTKVETEVEALEIIEMAIGDIDLLARAFQVITEACNELQNVEVDDEDDLEVPPRMMIN